MARKNMGKVKRYRRSFYSGSQKAKRIAGMALGLAALFLAGWLIGPAVIDFGTSTWYRLKRGGGAASSQSQPSQSVSQPAASAAPQPTPAPTAQPAAALGQGSWAFVSISSLGSAEQAAETARTLAGQGVTYAVVPYKDSQGYVYCQSGVETARSAISATTFDAGAAQALRQAGITPVAAICAFRDPLAPSADRSLAVLYQDTEYFWLDASRDAGGKPWLNPYAPGAADYISALMDEARSLGFEQILLSGVQFPGAPGQELANFGDTAGVSMGQRLGQVLAAWQQSGVCWVEYPLEQLAAGADSPQLTVPVEQLGVENLMIRADDALSEEQQLQLQAVVQAAKAAGTANVALVQGGTVTLL